MRRKYTRQGDITLGHGNTKIDKSIAIFNIPAGSEFTCSQDCPGCYAKKAQRLYPHVLPCRVRNWEASKQENFTENMIKCITKTGCKVVRIHESGDFYSQEYADKWDLVAKAMPHIKFYGYTRENVTFTSSNINMVSSWLPGGENNYGNKEHVIAMAKKYSAKICPATTPKGKKNVICGKNCKACQTAKYVVFYQH